MVGSLLLWNIIKRRMPIYSILRLRGQISRLWRVICSSITLWARDKQNQKEKFYRAKIWEITTGELEILKLAPRSDQQNPAVLPPSAISIMLPTHFPLKTLLVSCIQHYLINLRMKK